MHYITKKLSPKIATYHNMRILLILFLFILQSNTAFSESNACEHLFKKSNISFDEFLATSNSTKLLTALPQINDRLVKRYWDHSDVNFITDKLLSKLGGETNSFDLPQGSWIISRGLIMENFLFLDLVHIQQKNIIQNTSLEVGKTASSINTLFIKVLVGYIKAASVLTSHHKEINTLVIRGVNIKNKMLLQLLEDNDFKENNLHIYSNEREKIINL